MNCQRCNVNPAEVQYTEVVGGEKSVQWLCSACASTGGLTWTTDSTLSVNVNLSIGSKPAESDASLKRRCPDCATTLSAIRRTGRVGCPACYATFTDHLRPLLKRVHQSETHQGHTPARPARVLAGHSDLERLTAELREAVEAEDFERAARLRDRISAAGGDPEAEA